MQKYIELFNDKKVHALPKSLDQVYLGYEITNNEIETVIKKYKLDKI